LGRLVLDGLDARKDHAGRGDTEREPALPYLGGLPEVGAVVVYAALWRSDSVCRNEAFVTAPLAAAKTG
jgi:hypothetical protein